MHRTTKQQQERARLYHASMAFAGTRLFAMELAKKGNRDSARWWGAQARSDWRALHHLLTR